MKIKKVNPKIKYLYHYTKKENVTKILEDKKIKSKDSYVFFTGSLNDTIHIFDNEIMQKDKIYVDVDGNLKRREKCNKQDYCILKIPYVDDDKFYQFEFSNQDKNSIYSYSIPHKGEYSFKKAKILDFPQYKNLSKVVPLFVALGALAIPYNALAASWLDDGNYDISWYNSESISNYDITNAKELAGLSYLVNKEHKTFAEKNISINSDIDLTENTWEGIEEIFKGNICGAHRIILNYNGNRYFENYNELKVIYQLNVLMEGTTLTKVELEKPYTVESLLTKLHARTVLWNNINLSDDTVITSLDINETNSLEVYTQKYYFFVDYSGKKEKLQLESGDSIRRTKELYANVVAKDITNLIFKYQGKELNDEKTISDYNIQYGSVINVYEKIEPSIKYLDSNGTIEFLSNNILIGEDNVIKIKPNKEYELDVITINGEDKTDEVKNSELIINPLNTNLDIQIGFKLIKKNVVIEKNPNTFDHIMWFLTLNILALSGIMTFLYKLIKKFRVSKYY